jgi:hypothetical protein
MDELSGAVADTCDDHAFKIAVVWLNGNMALGGLIEEIRGNQEYYPKI